MTDIMDIHECVSCKKLFQNEDLLGIHCKTMHPEFYLASCLTKRDADNVKDIKCNWCTKPSTARIRYYASNNPTELSHVIGCCDDHLHELKKLMRPE